MSLPSPQYPLDDTCSVIYNNTLFSYSSHGHLQSLELETGAEWKQLPKGVPVTGAACVKATPADAADTALWVVGGSSPEPDFPGLQRYNFADEEWETITVNPLITKNRLYHNAVYLNASDLILVYAGTQDGTQQPTSATFTMQASGPHDVLAHESLAPPAISPLLMPWTDNQAVMIYNTRAMVFDPSISWFDSGATLSEPLYNTSSIKSLIVNGDDASKSLYTFDMTVSPNVVNRTILVGSNAEPIPSAKPVVTRGLELRTSDEEPNLIRRDSGLTVADWPPYNPSLVPSSIRSSSSMAQDEDGLVVISGGNRKDVLCMFQAKENRWVNATKALVSPQSPQQPLTPSTTAAAPIPSGTASLVPEDDSSPAAAPFPKKILGAVLGSILGVAFILLVALLLFRWRRKRKQYSDAGHQRRASGIPSDEKDSTDFAGRGLPRMSSTRQYRTHVPQDSQASFSSVAILMGRVGGHRRGSDRGDGSDSSSQFNKKYRAEISNPIPQERVFKGPSQAPPEPGGGKTDSVVENKGVAVVPRPRVSRGGHRGSTRRSSGWNRYWSGGSSMNILGFGSKRTTYEESDGDTESYYSEQRLPSQVTQVSATVPPLKLGSQPELNRVVTGNPSLAHASSQFPLREMSGHIARPGSMNSLSSYDDDDRRDAFSSGVPASVHEQTSWTPVEGQGWAGRPYNESAHPAPQPRGAPSDARRNTQFPGAPSRPAPAQVPSDMSWLNLGNSSKSYR